MSTHRGSTTTRDSSSRHHDRTGSVSKDTKDKLKDHNKEQRPETGARVTTSRGAGTDDKSDDSSKLGLEGERWPKVKQSLKGKAHFGEKAATFTNPGWNEITEDFGPDGILVGFVMAMRTKAISIYNSHQGEPTRKPQLHKIRVFHRRDKNGTYLIQVAHSEPDDTRIHILVARGESKNSYLEAFLSCHSLIVKYFQFDSPETQALKEVFKEVRAKVPNA